jgi:hypothetical protein
MRLSDAKARRLTRLIWRERALRWLPVAAVVLAMLGAYTFFMEQQIGRADPTVNVQVHEASVISVKRSTAARSAAVVHAYLDDGREVDALSALRPTPQQGSHVVISEARHVSGRLTYDVMRFAE